MKNLILIGCVLLVFACGTDNKSNSSNATSSKEPITAVSTTNEPKAETTTAVNVKSWLPKACDLLTKKKVSEEFAIGLGQIKSNEGSPNSQTSTSCFFRWDAIERANSGVLLQLMTNPVPGEIENWTSSFMESKRTTGEQMLGFDAPVMFETLKGGVVDGGLYSHEIQKAYWLLDNEVVLLIAFNLDVEKKKFDQLVKLLGAEIIENYNEHLAKMAR